MRNSFYRLRICITTVNVNHEVVHNYGSRLLWTNRGDVLPHKVFLRKSETYNNCIMAFALIEVDQGPCGNGMPARKTTVAVSNTLESLVEYCKDRYGKPIQTKFSSSDCPEPFSWDDYFIIEPTKTVIV